LLRYPLYQCCESGRIFFGSGSYFLVDFVSKKFFSNILNLYV
jgi:hypothetical protein